MSKDFHDKPFDEGTLAKLSLFSTYLDEWIPVFVAALRPRLKVINIFDLFAGPGRDEQGRAGSPLLILNALLPYAEQIRGKGLQVNVVLNETAKWKIAALKETIAASYQFDMPVRIKLSRLLFTAALREYRPLTEGAANLLFLDQSGMKQITEDVFRELAAIPATDFMFFISSSYIGRFADHPSFRKYGNFSKEAIRALPYFQIHRAVIDYYRSLIPANVQFYVGGFSIKKGRNIYGLIFGSGHPYGMEKFLRSCWKEDPERGEANFDIDREGIDAAQPGLPGMLTPKKLNAFEENLKAGILSGKVKSDGDAYLFALQEGCLPEHARPAVRKLIDDGCIKKFRPRISRDGWRDPRPIERI